MGIGNRGATRGTGEENTIKKPIEQVDSPARNVGNTVSKGDLRLKMPKNTKSS